MFPLPALPLFLVFPPPDPPGLPEEGGPTFPLPAPPPAVEVIVEKTELLPFTPQAPEEGPVTVPPAPPAPTVIGKPVAVTVIAVPEGEGLP